MIHPERRRGTQALMKNPPPHEAGKSRVGRTWLGSGGHAEPAAGSCSNRQERDGAQPGFARCLFTRRGPRGAAGGEATPAVRVLLGTGGTAALLAAPAPGDSPLRADPPCGATGGEDDWAQRRRLSIFNYVCFLLLLLLIYSPVKERQMYAVGPSPPVICGSGAVKCLFLISACP